MAAAESGNGLRVSKSTLALAIETAVHTLPSDAIERVMIAIHRVDLYRDYLGPAVERIGSATKEAVGEALNRTLVRERIGLTFHAPFTSEVIKSIVRTRQRGTERYGRDEFRRDFPNLVRMIERDNLDFAEDGELVRPESTQGPAFNTSWVAALDRNALYPLQTILREIRRMLKSSEAEAASIEIRDYWSVDYSLTPGPDERRREKPGRLRRLKILKQRGAIISFHGVRGAIEVVASKDVVDATLRAIADHFARRTPTPGTPTKALKSVAPRPPHRLSAPPRVSVPENKHSPLPTPAPAPAAEPASAKQIEELRKEYSKGFAGKLGEHSATALWLSLGFLFFLLIGVGLRKRLFAFYESVVHASAQPDTSSKK